MANGKTFEDFMPDNLDPQECVTGLICDECANFVDGQCSEGLEPHDEWCVGFDTIYGRC